MNLSNLFYIISCSTLLSTTVSLPPSSSVNNYVSYNFPIFPSFTVSNFPHLKTIHINIFSLNFKRQFKLDTKGGKYRQDGVKEVWGIDSNANFEKTFCTALQRHTVLFFDKFRVGRKTTQFAHRLREREDEFGERRSLVKSSKSVIIRSESFHGNISQKL